MKARLVRAADGVIAVGAAAGLAAEGLEHPRSSAMTAVIVVLAVLTSAPLLWRRRAPLVTWLFVGSGLLACVAVFAPYWAAIGVAMVSLYTVALRGDRRRSLIVGVITGVILVVAVGLWEATGSAPEGVTRLLLILGALVVGYTVRSRLELRHANAEREAQLRREREQAALLRAEEERLVIARELHDSIAHALVAINIRAGVTAHLGAEGTSGEALTDIQHIAGKALNDLRGTLDLLRVPGAEAPTLPLQGLEDIPNLFEPARSSGLTIQLDVPEHDVTVPGPVSQAAYRIVQESLTNVLRHAQASEVDARIRIEGDVLTIDVHDDGKPNAGLTNGGGHGVNGMAERAAALGGKVTAGPAEQGGWRVHAELPLPSRT